MYNSRTDGLLGGLRVLDLTDELGSPAVKLLADQGAEVIKVEPPAGSPERRLGPFAGAPDPDRSLRFWHFNTNRRARVLDLDQAGDRAVFHDLARGADLLIESLPPGHLAARGIGYPDLSRDNPGLIVVSISPFGQDGPWRDLPTTDLVAWMLGGPGSMCGLPDREPIRPAGAQPFHFAGLFTAIAALAALRHRDRTGRGQWVDVSIHEAVTALAESTLFFYQGEGVRLRRMGTQHPTSVPLGVWPAADGWAYLNCLPVAQWRALVGWMAEAGPIGDLADPKYEDHDERIADRVAIEGAVAAWFADRSRREIFERGQSLSIPTAFVARPDDVLIDPHLATRGYFQMIDQPAIGRSIPYPGPAFRALEVGRVELRPAPALVPEARPEWTPRRTDPHPNPLPGGEGAVSVSPPPNLRAGGEGDGILPPLSGPLAGVRIVDLTWVWAGPFATAVLADLGADVIKIEAPSGDINRTIPAFADGIPGPNRGLPFATYNRNKRSVRLNVRHPAGRDTLLALIREADVVIENFSAGTLERLGLGDADLRTVNPRLILVRLSGYGQTGPYAGYVSYAPTLHAQSGLTHLSGYPDGTPIGAGIALSDFTGGLTGDVAILAALAYRDWTGRGVTIDLGQYEAMVGLLGPALLDFAVNGNSGGPVGNRQIELVNGPHGVYPCRAEAPDPAEAPGPGEAARAPGPGEAVEPAGATDPRRPAEPAWIAVAVTSDEAWRGLVEVAGSAEWVRDPRFATAVGRAAQADDLDRLVAAWTADQDGRDLLARLRRAGVPAGLVQDGRDLLERDPQHAARGFFVPVDHPEIGPIAVSRSPFRLSETPVQVRRAGPLLGEHTVEVLREVLGLGDDDLAKLAAEGVI